MAEQTTETTGPLAQYGNELAETVARAGQSVVGVDDGTRLTASGVIWREDGVIVAASHAVERDEELFVVTHDGTRHPATLIGRDGESDIAVLKVEASGLPTLSPAAEASVRVGALALAVARPSFSGDFGLAATLGLVSSKRATETAGQPEYILYTDAALYPGFSGGALIEAGTGQFLGLLDRLYGRGLGVALGAPLVGRVAEALLTHGRMPRGYLGVRTQLVGLPESLRAGLGLAQTRGLLVANVEPGSPADTSGLMLGDTLIAIDSTPVEDIDDLKSHLHAGRQIVVRVLRGGALTDLSATVGADKG